ncbi:hypothetical protein [Roseospira visakhapatnamensis]|uniref:Lipoprotein n=1 Tax=Roseospira visakhapatnamensis TaxID=390880 RepID=A0A7W6R9S1_9PROT|nr:hypothetical protein [Roseospira visakhapatnamensis]MBB4264420.1 hypothetical protein [Roseospira visakhapatnamensis]
MAAAPSPRPRRSPPGAIVLVAASLLTAPALTACSGVFGGGEEARPCPPVRIDRAASTLTQFRADGGRDLTDVTLEAELVGYQGACEYDDDGRAVEVEVTLGFTAALGPGARSRDQTFQYFVAVPRYFPSPVGKKVFDARLVFPEGTDRIRYVGEELRLRLPLDLGESGAAYPVYLGFQLSAEELEYNRAQRPGRP